MGYIYVATNTVNGKKYVGKTVHSVSRRRFNHKLLASKGSTNVFHLAIIKYGFKRFSWKVVFEHADEQALHEAEIAFILRLRTKIPHGYNMTDGGEGISGMTHSEEARKKIRTAAMGNQRWLGRKLTEEHKQKLRASNLGKHAGARHNEEAKRKIAEAGLGRVPWCKGKKLSEKTKRKMSESHKGKVFSEEHKLNLRKNHAKAMLGRKHSEETRAKMREAHKRRKLQCR